MFKGNADINKVYRKIMVTQDLAMAKDGKTNVFEI